MFSNLEHKQAAAVKGLQERLRFPSKVTLAKAIEFNILSTCQYNRRDIIIANKFFCPSKGSLKTKSTTYKRKMDTQDKVMEDIPPEVMNEYRDVHLAIDIIFVNRRAFLTAISRHRRMIHARAILDRKSNQLKDAITAVKSEYENRGFEVKTMHGNNKFARLKDWLIGQGVTLETYDTNQHVPESKRTNRFLKERIQCIRMDMPFK